MVAIWAYSLYFPALGEGAEDPRGEQEGGLKAIGILLEGYSSGKNMRGRRQAPQGKNRLPASELVVETGWQKLLVLDWEQCRMFIPATKNEQEGNVWELAI